MRVAAVLEYLKSAFHLSGGCHYFIFQCLGASIINTPRLTIRVCGHSYRVNRLFRGTVFVLDRYLSVNGVTSIQLCLWHLNRLFKESVDTVN